MSDILLNGNLRKSETLFKREVQQGICLCMRPKRKSETLSQGIPHFKFGTPARNKISQT